MLCCGSLAAKEPGLAGMLLESGLASACRSQGCVGSACSMLCCCGLFDFFNNQSKLRDVDCKTFLIHGTSDSVVRVSNSRTNQTRLQHSYAPYYVRQRLLFLDLPALSVSLSRRVSPIAGRGCRAQ